MATKEWLGDGSANLFNVAGNWTPSGVPGAGDVALFNDKANGDNCNFNITTGSSLTIGEIIVESTYGGTVLLQTVPVTKGIFLGKVEGIKADTVSTIDFRQGGSGSEYGTYKSFANRFLMIDGVGSWGAGITLNMYGGSVVTKFDDGDHSTTVLKTGSFAPNYVAPTGTSGKTTFTAFTADDGITFQPTGNLVDNDRLKHFDFGSFTYSDDLFNAGAATCEFKATSSGIYFPITGATGYGQSPSTTPSAFVSYMRKVILTADTAGHKILFNDNNYVSLEELEIGDGVMLLGPTALTAQGADIRLVNAPKIRGSWSFSQISQGVYRSPRHASGPMPKIAGNFNITGKLDVGGLIDPTGLELTPVGSNPGGVTANTLWLNSGQSNKLYHGSSEVGGGSGDITGVTITTDSGGGSKAEDTGGSADFSILGATGVGVTNSGATITAVAVPAEIDHDSLQNFVAAEHVDWAGASAGTIHASNYTDTNTQLSNAEVVSAVEAESTLVLQSGVTVGTDLKMTTSSDNAIIENVTQDKDIIFQVNDGGSANTEVMRIDGSTSRVGIGETSPDAPLHVKGSGNGTILKIESTSTDSMTPDIEFVNMTAPTAGDNLGNIEYIGKRESSVGADDLTTPVDYARIYAGIDGAEGSTVNSTLAGKIGMQLFHQGARKTMLFMEGHPTGGGFVTVNYNGEDMDFRVHGEDTSNLFFINGGSGSEGVTVGGQTVPKSMFTVDGTITLKERGDATGDTAGYGQVWVHDQNAGELMFTTDTGTDIQLTSGTDGPVFPSTEVTTTNGLWNDISADISASGVGVNVLVNNWDFTSGTSALDSAMSSGIFTCTAALAGKYLVIAKIQYKPNGLTDGTRNHKLQILNYRHDTGGTPEDGTLVNFARHMNANYFGGYILETTFTVDLTDGDTFATYAKIAVSSGSGTWKIASGSTAMTSLTMVKIA